MKPQIGLTRDENHVYCANYPPLEPVTLPGVTGVLRVLNKPAIVPWAQRVVAEAAIDNRDKIADWVSVGGRDGAVDLLKKAATQKRDEAASIGSKVHALAEAVVRGQALVIPEDLAPFVVAYQEWVTRFEPKFLAVEEMVCGDGYAGTLDAIAVIGGETWLLDIKTSKGTYAETAQQLAAYGHANYIGRPGDPNQYAMPEIDQYGVIHVRPEGAELVPYDVTDREYEAFQDCLRVSRWFSQRAGKVIGQPVGPALLNFPHTKEAVA